MAITLSVTPTTIKLGEKVTATVVWDYTDVCLAVQRVTIFWGDGTTDYIQDPIPCAGQQIWEHIYALGGQYDVFADIIFFDLVGTSVVDSSNHVIVTVTVPQPPSAQPAPLPPTPTPIKPPEGPPITRPLLPTEPPPLLPPPPPILPDVPPRGPIRPDVPIRQPPMGRLYASGDNIVWNKFVNKWGDRVGRWALQVPLDTGLDREDLEEPWRSMVAKLTTHKADFVIEWGRIFYIGEIKPRGSIAGLGSALIQWQMAIKRYKFDKMTRPALICETISPILLPIAAQNGIVVFVTDGLDTELGARIIEI